MVSFVGAYCINQTLNNQHDKMNYTYDSLNDCPSNSGAVFTIVIYMIYVLILNVLLINLLIAIFK